LNAKVSVCAHKNATINYSAVSINNHLKKHARCTEILMHGASSSINKNAVSHEAHWFISVYDLLPKLVKNIHLVSNNFWNPQTKFLKPQNRKYVTPKSRFLKP
jgi:hypothetical protein